MTLHEKGLAFETREENLKDFSTELKLYHPEAKVPVLKHGDRVFYESCIITEYLEEAFPTPRLMPAEPALRAQVRLWTYWCNQSFKPDLDRFKYRESRFPTEELQPAIDRLPNHLDKLDKRLQESAWLVGDSLTLADIHVFPFFRQLSRVKPAYAEIGNFIYVNRWFERLTARPAFQKTMEKKIEKKKV